MGNQITLFGTRSLRPVVTGGASLIPLLVSRVRSRESVILVAENLWVGNFICFGRRKAWSFRNLVGHPLKLSCYTSYRLPICLDFFISIIVCRIDCAIIEIHISSISCRIIVGICAPGGAWSNVS